MAKKAAAKNATKFVTSIQKGGDKKPAAKRTAAKAVKLPAINPGTIAGEVETVWGGIRTLDQRSYQTVASFKEWLEQEIGDIQNAIDLLGEYDDDANPWTTRAG